MLERFALKDCSNIGFYSRGGLHAQAFVGCDSVQLIFAYDHHVLLVESLRAQSFVGVLDAYRPEFDIDF